MQREEVRSRLQWALNMLHRNEVSILDRQYNVNERTITFRLAMYLCKKFSDYDVDCEYNRMVDHEGVVTEGDYWAKKVVLERAPVPGDDDEAQTVFPDIIIHKRKRADKNLAVIEVKMAWKNGKKDFDLLKLEAYKKDLKYQYAIFLEIGETSSAFTFIE